MSEAAAHANGFRAGFVSRTTAPASVLELAFAPAPPGFSPRDIMPLTAATRAAGPRHFHPADPESNPTEGWDPLDPAPVAEHFVDPIEAAHTAGFEAGMAAAHARMTADAARDRALVETLLARIGDDDRIDRAAIARQLRETVMLLVARVVGEAGVSADLLAQRVRIAADMLADASESAILRVNPEDVALIEGKLPQSIFAAGDASVARGSFVLEAASTVIEDGPALWLDQLTQAIDRVSVPGC